MKKEGPMRFKTDILWKSRAKTKISYAREQIEHEARPRGCVAVHPDTHDFQAAGFYS